MLYFGTDWILRRMEAAAGRHFKYRSFIFFGILLTMALVSFALIRTMREIRYSATRVK